MPAFEYMRCVFERWHFSHDVTVKPKVPYTDTVTSDNDDKQPSIWANSMSTCRWNA